MHWMVYAESMNSTLFTDYLGYLIEDVPGKIFLIVDRARYHTSQETTLWLMDHKDRIELSSCRLTRQTLTRTNGSGRT